MLIGGARAALFGQRWPKGYTNLGGRFLSGWAAKLAQVKAGTANASVICLGGSTMRGVGVGTGAAFDQGGDELATPKLLADVLVANGIPAIHNGVCGGSLGPTPGTDSRVTYGSANWGTIGNASLGSIGGVGNGCFSCQTAGDTTALGFAPVAAFDTISTRWLRNTSRDTFTIDVDGGAALASVPTAGTSSFQTTQVSCALGTHTINIKRTDTTTGGIHIAVIETWNSAIKTVRVLNAGASSATISNIATGNAAFGPMAAITAMAPDLVICAVGGNDCLNGTPEGSYKTDLQTVCTTVGAGKIILASHTPIDASGVGGEAARQAYTKYTRDIAVANNAPFVDLTYLQGTYAATQAAGLIAGGSGNHMNDYHSITNFLAEAVIV